MFMAKLKIFVFGTENDPVAWKVADMLQGMEGMEFVKTDNPDDVLKYRNFAIMDAVRGIDKPMLLRIDELKGRSSVSAHDLDLGTMLVLFKKAGKIGNVRIIGIPLDAKVDEKLASRAKLLLDAGRIR